MYFDRAPHGKTKTEGNAQFISASGTRAYSLARDIIGNSGEIAEYFCRKVHRTYLACKYI
jgi:hypothetical protein